ncbi:MAG: iron-containing alcohol dehydrogenase [Alkalispirochaeta sp.]
MSSFTIARQPRLIVQEDGIAQLSTLLRDDGHTAVIIVTGGRSIRGREQWAQLMDALLEQGLEFLEFTVRGEPSPGSVDAIVSETREELPQCSAVVAIGGGSVIDTGKAAAAGLGLTREEFSGGIARYLEGVGDLSHPGRTLPLYALPSTAGTGSEATKNAVLSETGPTGFKKSLRHDNFIPHTALIDPLLHLECPRAVTLASGLDAVTQLVEAFVSTKANPITDALALEGLRLAGPALEKLSGGTDSPHLRRDMAVAAYLSGVCLANAGLGLVHGFASPLGARHEIPHGVVCGLLVGPVSGATVSAMQELSDSAGIARYATAAQALGLTTEEGAAAGDQLVQWFRELAGGLGRLSDYGFVDSEIDELAHASGLKNHPIDLTAAQRGEILREVL